MLVMAIEGAAPEILADGSRELVARLAGNPQFRFVTNGEMSFDAVPDELLDYRYLLSPTLDRQVSMQSFCTSKCRRARAIWHRRPAHISSRCCPAIQRWNC